MSNTEVIVYSENIRQNLRNIQKKIGRTEISAVIKGDAYSHGLLAVAKICAEEGIRKLCVGSVDEAVLLRRNGIEAQAILLLLPPNKENIEALVRYHICPTVYKPEHLELINRTDHSLPFEIEIDTGIGRSGCRKEIFYTLLDYAAANKMNLSAVYTHLYNKECRSDCVKQLADFNLCRRGLKGVKYHIGGAYALCYGEDFLLDELRVGIGMYGLADMTSAGILLKPALELNSKICDIIHVKKGQRIGYDKNKHVFQRDSRLALLNFGYSNGYPELKKNIVKVKDHFCEIVGGINMMNCCVDITQVSGVEIGDWINIYSTDNKDLNSILQLSRINDLKPGKFIYGLNQSSFERKYL